jgi:hypothetical protein
MGFLNWFRRQQSDEPDIIPLPSVRPPASTFWCDVVRCNETGFVGMSTRGPELRLEFSHLDRVAIRTTDEGPGGDDVFWLLVAGEQECLIPHGAPGETELFERLLKLPAFDSQAMIVPMTSGENIEVECWSRK